MPRSRKMNRQPRRQGGPRSANLDRGGRRQQDNVGFPDRMLAKLSYCDYRRVNPGVVSYADTVYNLNSVFDPENSGVGHQPRGFDVLAGLYNKYRVHKCRSRIEVRQRAAHGLAGILLPNNSSTALTTADLPMEQSRSTRIPLTGASQPVTLVDVMYDCAQVLGQTRAQYMANEDTSALVTANPTEGVFSHVFLWQPDSATVLDCEFVHYLTYEVEFFDRKFDGPSSIARELVELQEQVSLLQAHFDEQEVAGDDQPVVVRRAAPPQPSNPGPVAQPRAARADSRPRCPP
jgi:hypothetical protein